MYNKRDYQSEVLCGNRLLDCMPEDLSYENLSFHLSGVTGNGERNIIPFTSSTLSRHVLMLGGIGTGKTNVFNMMIGQLKPTLTENDILIIFDTKGDYYNQFYQNGDIVISTDETATGNNGTDYWNIFQEIDTGSRMMENITEISKMLFAEACEKTNQIFFPNAARGLFEACLYHFLQSDPSERSNYWLAQYIFSSTAADLRAMLSKYPQFRAMISYIASDESPQTQGVLSELQQVCREIFIGNFAEVGSLAMRDMVQKKNGKTIFVEYDLSVGKALTPIYSLLYDVALKTALGRKRSEGNVYLFTDEFRLLPHLEHIDDAVNFGRSLGIKLVVGVQNVEQIYENYGEERARSILSGFQSLFAFRLNDSKSREHVQGFFGKNRKLESFRSVVLARGMTEETRESFVVEDWDVMKLRTGQAIAGLPGQEPFIYQFDFYQ